MVLKTKQIVNILVQLLHPVMRVTIGQIKEVGWKNPHVSLN